MSNEYIPISCADYSRYELAILRGQALRVSWRGARGVAHVETLIPLDLRTRTHAEFLIARNQEGSRRVLRLDRIRHAEPVGLVD
ncbi:MAG: transcriptional antiterminator, Rof [Gammaproteobacteria bacterium]|jgi:Rho-binding antiterminator